MRSSTANRGRGLEALVEISQRNVVRLTKMGAHAKWIGGGKQIVVAGPVDYVGEFVGSGRAIHFDAKEAADHASFPLDKVPKHQIEHLRVHGQAGAVAGLLVAATHPELGHYLWLPWDSIGRFGTRVAWDDPAWLRLGSWPGVIDLQKLTR